jgi:two-component system chemotaxis sensor kinase CheA
MNDSEQAFLETLRKAFALEAGEHLETLSAGLIGLEKPKDPANLLSAIESAYRAAHSLKGAARSVNLPAIGAVCQSMESVFAAMKQGGLTAGAADFDILQHAVDSMAAMLALPPSASEPDVRLLIEQLEGLATRGKGGSPSSPSQGDGGKPGADVPPLPTRPASLDTIRIATARLDAILLQAEELISVKLTAEQRLTELADTLAAIEVWKAEWEKVGPGLRRSPSEPPGPVEVHMDRMGEVEARLRRLLAALRSDRRATGLLVDQLLENTKTLLMLPFSTLLQTFPRMVRDIAREQGKEVDLVFTGGDVEIDKRILEQMKDPLIHLLRNGVDHGIEAPDVRRARGKAPRGTISVNISPAEGNRVQLLVADDGGGITAASLREAAVQRGLLSGKEAGSLDERSSLALMFQSGVSTSKLITDLSGRGLGMAIVQEAVDKLGGVITVNTTPGEGSTFRISLPLTLATFHGLLVEEGGHRFAVPMANVERVRQVRKEEIRTVENRETLMINEAPLALVRLGRALGMPDAGSTASENRPLCSVMVLAAGHQRMAFVVDRLLHEQEILLKGLGKQLTRVRNIAGATVLGSGSIVPVLNVADLFKSAVEAPSVSPQQPEIKPRKKSILVAEDSITSRMLLKNILVSAGFEVHTVIDGIEAWTALKERRFDAVVSDIQMPRMNGFDLTARIRHDAPLTELPVVLVTSLDSRADRERGIEVGASAYIVKSSFEQSNLLDVIRRLL